MEKKKINIRKIEWSVRPLPKWIMLAYSRIWNKFKDNQFDHKKADVLLKENVSIILSRLKKSGWLKISLDPNDSRKRLYKLISPMDAVKDIGKA